MEQSSRLVDASQSSEKPTPPTLSSGQIFLRFLRFGLLAWGGPFAQIAMVRRELIDEERWISSSRFNRLLAVYQVLPGPEAHELCVHMGMLTGGRLGGFLAGLGFMLPGFLLMLVLSWLYVTAGFGISAVEPSILGVQVAVIAMIVRAIHRIGAHILLDRWLWTIAAVSTVASAFGVSFWIVLPAAGLIYAFVKGGRILPAMLTVIAALCVAWLAGIEVGTLQSAAGDAASEGRALVPPTFVGLFLSGLKAGLLTFGGAYTAIPFVRNDAVGNGWMTDGQFLDGLALSGLLPAPLIIFSTFVGYIGGGLPGAVAMTTGVFLPAFGFTLLFYDKLEQVVQNKSFHRVLEGVSAAVVGLVVATAFELTHTVMRSVPNIWSGLLIFALALAVLYGSKSRISVMYAVAMSGALGLMLFSSQGG